MCLDEYSHSVETEITRFTPRFSGLELAGKPIGAKDLKRPGVRGKENRDRRALYETVVQLRERRRW
jgi:hypothetical protein